MKLIHCNECRDVISLRYEWRYCICGQSSGHYIDNLNAEIKGPCIPLGFANASFNHALLNQPEKDWGNQFNAFVIEKQCPTIKVIPELDCTKKKKRKKRNE